MNLEKPHSDQAPIASAAGTVDPLLHEALRRALLRSLCHKLHSVWDRQQQYSPQFQWLEQVDIVAEMIGDMVGLKFEAVHLAFEDNAYMGDGLIAQLEPLLGHGHGSWMTDGCL
jgi:hypothetical protein